MSGPLHLYLLFECEAARKVKQLDEFADPPASKTSTKDGRHFPSGMIGNPVSRHEPSRPPSNFFATQYMSPRAVLTTRLEPATSVSMAKAKKPPGKHLAAARPVESLIRVIRGQKVILDADLAALYGVETKQLNRAVKRNLSRFPEEFMFRLTQEERLRSQFGTASKRNVRFQPLAFTEHGVVMLSSVLNSER